MRLSELEEEEAKIEAAYQTKAADDFLVFARGLKIASQDGPKVFDRCMAPFQRVFLEDIAESLQCLQRGDMPELKNWWVERTKKASKDADLAVIVVWLIAFAKRPLYIQIGAANKEQAAIVKSRIEVLLELNHWLEDLVSIVNWEVRSEKKMRSGGRLATLHIMSSDIAGAHGGTPDLLIVNELSHVTKWEFVENLMDNASGVKRGMVIIATNAGFKGTKAEVWRKNAIVSDTWGVHVLARPAPWHDKAALDDARARNTNSRYSRLWRGVWASGKGDALDEYDIERCFILKGPLSGPEEGWTYLGGMDLGISHDHSGLVFVGVNVVERKLRLAVMRAWEPTMETGDGRSEVDLDDVENKVYSLNQLFRPVAVYYDPTEARLMAQRLRKRHVPMREMSFSSGTNLTRMAECLIQVVEHHIIECFDDEDGRLRRDFGKFHIVEKTYGYKLEAVRDEFGHADVGTALVITLPAAVDMLEGINRLLSPTDIIVDTNDAELSDEEVDDMPDDLRAIYKMDEVDHPRMNRD